MSIYSLLFPPGSQITSNKFTYNGAKFTLFSSSIEYSSHNKWQAVWYFFNYQSSTANVAPPHYVGVRCDNLFITDEFSFMAHWDLVYMTCKNYNIEVSMDGSKWDIVYSGVVPEVSGEYYSTCSFSPVVCKYIRVRILSTYDRRGYSWFQGGYMKVYGKLLNSKNIYIDKYNNIYSIEIAGDNNE